MAMPDVDYRSPCRMIWDLAGRPDPTDPAKGEGVCALCGEHGPLHMKIGPNFTDYRKLTHIDGTHTCKACSWALGGKPPNTIRMWTVVARIDRPSPHVDFGSKADPAWVLVDEPDITRESLEELRGELDADVVHRWEQFLDLPAEARGAQWVRVEDYQRVCESLEREVDLLDIAGTLEAHPASEWRPPQIPIRPYVEGEFLHATNRKDMRWVASTLAAPPADGSPWLVAVAESGQKHTAPFAPVNHGRERWTVHLDGTDITSTPSEWRHVLTHTVALRAVTVQSSRGQPRLAFPAIAVETGQPSVVALQGAALAAWKNHAPRLRPYLRTPLLHLANFVITKETLGDYISTFPV